MAGPVVGIAGASYTVSRPWGDLPVHGIARWYADQVHAVGGRPLLLPPGANPDLLDVLDGLVLAGGGDLDPALHDADVTARDVDRERDDAELELARAARERLLPTLGVCRGLQVFAVLDGGSLVSGLPHVLPDDSHPISTIPGSVCASLLGGRSEVSSLHHQAAARLGPGWQVTATADDGVVEALEWKASAWPALGVQWHPELDSTGPAVFGWLVGQALVRGLRSGGHVAPTT